MRDSFLAALRIRRAGRSTVSGRAVQCSLFVGSRLISLSLGAVGLCQRSIGLILSQFRRALLRVGRSLQIGGVRLQRIRLRLGAGRIRRGRIGLNLSRGLLVGGAHGVGLVLMIIRARLFASNRVRQGGCGGECCDRRKGNKFHHGLLC